MKENIHLSNSRREFLRNALGAATASVLIPGYSLANETERQDTNLGTTSSCDVSEIEPDVELAKFWWPDQRNVWTPIGWKDHFFRFNVLYNGTILSEPFSDLSSRKHAVKFKGDNFLVRFTPWPDINVPALPTTQVPQWTLDGGHGVQGWKEGMETPVLWTDFQLQEGMVIRQEVFGHLLGGGDVKDGLEPVFAWIRLTVTHVDPIRSVETFPMILQLSANYHELIGRFTHENGVTVDVLPHRVAYPKQLSAILYEKANQIGLRVVEPDGKIRFSVLPTSRDRVSFFSNNDGTCGIKVDFQAKIGDYADFLMPMFPTAASETSKEEELGFNGALVQSNAYWKNDLLPENRFRVPEDYITEAIYRNVKYVPVLTSVDYKTKEYSFLSGSWGYDQLWPTPTSMNSHMFLSLLGEHKTVEKYTRIYKIHQGTIKPPGGSYDLHSGYYASPNYLTSIDWLADHGAVLLQVSTHALLSGDQIFINEWTDSIIKACDFIKDACAKKAPDSVEGLMPPAVATDDMIPTQSIWSLAWNYKGLTKAIQMLKKIKHSRADEFDVFAKQYKATFVRAFREASAEARKWKDREGNEYPVPVTSLSKVPPPRHVYDDAFALDVGPLVLVWAGLFDADDPLMVAATKFFREGPNWSLKGPRYNAVSRAVLEHEMSSCEPCYSWNVMHSWQLSDRKRYLEGMYSLFVGSLSQQTYTSCEHRTGMQGTLFSTPLAFWMARMALIDDEIKENELHLLRFCPLAWISSSKETVLKGMPTLYGPVDLIFKGDEKSQQVYITFKGDWREGPQKVVLHIPPVRGLRSIVVNGKKYGIKKPIELN
ncbi:hypothetical protein [Sphingobacterium chuzhouense]|uniref:Alpha-L-rhamnosidase six-hairpin glycosidase domain-containing protein n=1 Tax=Sphingobacterium chuzhouense TaxID=1742264 RepID=A0ABR7XNY0_9SPHI|nr:hypothetical protein [Sphingobacterium chuzhouense]MBD1420884.1 hypothetical protein [Sphingobacterium chuzhouense]